LDLAGANKKKIKQNGSFLQMNYLITTEIKE